MDFNKQLKHTPLAAQVHTAAAAKTAVVTAPATSNLTLFFTTYSFT